ncbi:MAG: hypothetical protein E5299_00182 [Burkholderia gladioli]|nr:MAG: hypothetical protein E5299_00182 [Burkholderia gladioli]
MPVYGEGAWKGFARHGYSKRHTWRKVHLALDLCNHAAQMHAALITHRDVADDDALAKLLD